MIPARLQDPKFGFCLIRSRDKKPFEDAWPDKAYHFDDPRLLAHINNGGNYGIICGGKIKLLVVDVDDTKLLKWILHTLPPTFTVKTGSGKIHLYYFVDDAKAFAIPGIDFRGDRTQAVGPGSTHPSGGKYEVLYDAPITQITRSELLAALGSLIGPQFTPSESARITARSKNALVGEIKRVLKVSDLLNEYGVDTTHNPTMCPLGHSSKGGKCFSFDDNKEVWKCWHAGCDEKGDVLTLYALKQGLDIQQNFAQVLADLTIKLKIRTVKQDGKLMLAQSAPEPESPKQTGSVSDKFLDPLLLKHIHAELSKTHRLDDSEKMTCFITASTAYLAPKDRKSFAVIGDSSVGKDNILDTLLLHLPGFTKLTRGTTAFIEDELTGKRGVLFSEVNKHREEGANSAITETIKQLTEGGLKVGKKDARTGFKTARESNTEQMCVGYGTTEEQRDAELDTRFICINVKAPPSKVMAVNRDTLYKAGLLNQAEVRPTTWIKDSIESLDFKDTEPVIPYALLLKDVFDNENPRSMRDVKRLLAITKGLAWLYQKQRYSYNGRVLAEPCDFINAWIIAGPFLTLSYIGMDARLKEITDWMDKQIGKVRRSEIQRAMGVKSVNTIKKRIKMLCEMGYVRFVELAGKEAYYERCQTTYQDLSKGVKLPALIDLLAKYDAKTLTPFDTFSHPVDTPKNTIFLPFIDDKTQGVKPDLSRYPGWAVTALVGENDTLPLDTLKVLELVKRLDKGNGADWEEVAKHKGEDAVMNALANGDVFEYKPGWLKVLE